MSEGEESEGEESEAEGNADGAANGQQEVGQAGGGWRGRVDLDRTGHRAEAHIGGVPRGLVAQQFVVEREG